MALLVAALRSGCRTLAFKSCGRRSCSTVAPSASVTRANFAEALQQLKEYLKTADYVSIDLEMSGVHSAPWRRSLEVDTMETRYQNIRDSGEKFSIFQCGVCLFRYDTSTLKFMAYPYNFYLFPRNELKLGAPQDFLCQTSSLEFLAKHQFDFNACIYNGISYLSRTQEDAARAELEKQADDEQPPATEILSRRTSDVLFSERARLQVALWRTSKIMSRHKAKASDETSETSFPSLIVNVADKHQALLVVQAVNKNFDDLVAVFEEAETEAKQVKVIYVLSKEYKTLMEKKLAKMKDQNRESMLMDCVGFRHVIDAISDSRKPVVGHNCILDLAHIHNKFIGPLPDKYSKFCATISQLFPCVMDTKYMLKAETSIRGLGLPGTSLSTVYAFFFGEGPAKKATKKPFPRVKVDVADDFQRYSDASLKHEAGYDAYMTGAIFAQIWRLITPDDTNTFAQQMKNRKLSYKVYANLLYMGYSGHFVLDLSSGKEATGKKALPNRIASTLDDSALLVWSQSKVGTSGCLKKLVKSCFNGTELSAEVEVVSVDETSAFLLFSSPKSLEAFVRASESDRAQSQMSAQITAAGLKVSRFGAFEKLCQSSISARRLCDAIEMLKDFSEDEADMLSEDEDETEELVLCAVQGGAQPERTTVIEK